MFNKKNPMRYFSGSTFARLPLYKLAAGGTAVALTASIGLGAFAAGVTPFNLPTATPAPVVTATPETAATPTPSPSPTPHPDVENFGVFQRIFRPSPPCGGGFFHGMIYGVAI